MIESKKLLGKFERQLTKINKPPIKRKAPGIELANILKHLILISLMILVILVLTFWNFENLRSQSGTFSRFTLNLNSNQNHQIFHHLVYLKRSNSESNLAGGYFIGNARISLKNKENFKTDFNGSYKKLSAAFLSESTAYNKTEIKIYQELLSKIEKTPYKNYIELLISENFLNKCRYLKNLNDKILFQSIIKRMFHFLWNEPKIDHQKISNFHSQGVRKMLQNTKIPGTKINKKSNKIVYKRLPDIINIGSKKCGTAAFQFFINLHPNVTARCSVAKCYEQHHFDLNGRYLTGLNGYLKNLPKAHNSNNLIFEKTPRYIVNEDVPNRMVEMFKNRNLSNLKLIHIYCDPVKRAVSDYVHEISGGISKNKLRSKKFGNGDINYFVSKIVDDIEKCRRNRNKCPDQNYNFHQTVNDVYFKNKIPNPWSILTNGLYDSLIRKWMNHQDIDPKKNLLFVDGDELITDLPKIMINLENQLFPSKVKSAQDDNYFKLENFKKGPGGFWCYYPLGVTNEMARQCLSDRHKHKGRTRSDGSEVDGVKKNTKYVLTDKNVEKLKLFYRDSFKNFQEMIEPYKL